MNIGDKLPAFNLKGIDGEMYNQYAYADRYALLVIFTNNSCPVAVAYRNRIKNLLKRYEEDNLGIVRINSMAKNSESESLEEMKKMYDDLKLEHLYLMDEDQQMAKSFGANKVPEAFLFNSKRELVYKGAIDDSWENENMVTRVYLEDAIEAALDGIDVDYPEVAPVGCDMVWN
ncbi:redoxin domain-containing protein [Solitalea canadensis]|uniref:Peroxiredoxin n=1 Tax=Solitalea canadensis (strain ATCC 29591 / DSM 3403 / JCM 21819 / LMG 8368 / NBRC 15130 / NCIMB 12057 / USAM 9D) TaxID=929556 RepID=H8KRJ6_SOLCM|nr:redoxin domain-containing protein [Solitalea canadensis]AFD07521.1 Peroxiredoxin [Solitalea canadensis DSM 3403]